MRLKDFGRLHRPCSLLMVVLLGLGGVPAVRAAAPPALEMPDAGFFHPDTPLRFTIAEDYPEQILEQLGLELDDIDITRLVERKGQQAVVHLRTPMEPGTHVLRLVRYAPDGSIEELGYWELDVRQTRAFRRVGGETSGSFAVTHRVAANPRNGAEDAMQGGASLNLNLEGDKGRIDLQTGAIYNQGQSGRDADLTGYTLSAGYRNLDAVIGDQTLPLDNFLISNYARRGASGGYRSRDGRHRVQAFALLTSPVTGAASRTDDGRLATRRVNGAWLLSQVLQQADRSLAVQAAYLDGEGSNTGSGSLGDPTISHGKAATVVVDGSLLDRRLRIRGELAWSNYDFDVNDPSIAPLSDRAWSLGLTYQAAPTGSGWNWNLGLDLNQVGTWFRSLANPDLPADRRLLRAWAGLARNGLELQLSAARETDNIAQLAVLPTMGTTLYTANVSWAPATNGNGPLGQPQATLALASSDSREIRAASFGPTNARTRQKSAVLTLGFTYPSWNWGLTQGYTQVRDNTGFSGDSTQLSTELNAGIPLGQRGNLAPTLSWSRTRDDSSGLLRERTRQATLGGNYWLSPNRLSAALTASVNQTRSDTDPSDGEARSLSAELAWFVVPARAGTPGMTLKLTGSHQDSRDRLNPALNSRDWRVFLGAEIGWQPGQ